MWKGEGKRERSSFSSREEEVFVIAEWMAQVISYDFGDFPFCVLWNRKEQKIKLPHGFSEPFGEMLPEKSCYIKNIYDYMPLKQLVVSS